MIVRAVSVVIVALAFVALIGRAVDQEFASGSVLAEREVTAATALPRVGVVAGDRNWRGNSDRPSRSVNTPSAGIGTSLIVKQASKAESIRAIRLVFGRRAAPAIRVASCETGGTFNAWALGRAGERGIFQIHPIHFSWAQPWRLFDPVWNARVAWRLSRGGTSWRPWACRWAA